MLLSLSVRQTTLQAWVAGAVHQRWGQIGFSLRASATMPVRPGLVAQRPFQGKHPLCVPHLVLSHGGGGCWGNLAQQSGPYARI